MNVLQHKFIRSLLSATCALSVLCTAVAAQAEEEEVSPEVLAVRQAIQDDCAYYMRNIRPVYFPAVPYGWKVTIGSDNTVSYTHTKGSSSVVDTTIKMYYTRRTLYQDAATVMDDYVAKNSCEEKTMVGKGFYTTSCGISNTYAIVIGEPNNMYTIELIGNYGPASSAIISNYVNAIVSGKKVFKDRNIGEVINNSGN